MSTNTKAAKAPTKTDEQDKDWTYLAEKDPTALHTDMAAWIEEVTGVEVDEKTVQLVSVLRGVYQRSDRNKKRADYRPLPAEIVAKRSEHMQAAHAEASALVQARKAAEAAKKPAKKAAPAKPTTATKKAAPRTRKAVPAKKA